MTLIFRQKYDNPDDRIDMNRSVEVEQVPNVGDGVLVGAESAVVVEKDWIAADLSHVCVWLELRDEPIFERETLVSHLMSDGYVGRP